MNASLCQGGQLGPLSPPPPAPHGPFTPARPTPPAADAFMTSGSWQVLGYGLKHHGPIFCAFSAFTMETWWICKKKYVVNFHAFCFAPKPTG